MRGRFITFEGGEGSGKSTHAALLAKHLNRLGLEVVLTREPGGSTGAEIIRHILLSGIAKPLGAETEAILFAAARDDHVRNVIRPALVDGKWVVCDRFINSTRVYQGIARQGRHEADPRPGARHRRRRHARSHLLPRRAGDRRPGARHAPARADAADRFEGETVEFHEELRRAYRALAQEEPRRIVRSSTAGRRATSWPSASGSIVERAPASGARADVRTGRRPGRSRAVSEDERGHPCCRARPRAVRPCRGRAGPAREPTRAGACRMPG